MCNDIIQTADCRLVAFFGKAGTDGGEVLLALRSAFQSHERVIGLAIDFVRNGCRLNALGLRERVDQSLVLDF